MKKSISEIMGSSAPTRNQGVSRQLTFDDLPEILGDNMPKLDFTPLGRVRLINALANRFGQGFRNIAGISDLLKEFDAEADVLVKINAIKLRKQGGTRG